MIVEEGELVPNKEYVKSEHYVYRLDNVYKQEQDRVFVNVTLLTDKADLIVAELTIESYGTRENCFTYNDYTWQLGEVCLTEGTAVCLNVGPDSFLRLTTLLVRQRYPKLIAKDLFGVQPMSAPSGFSYSNIKFMKDKK